LKLGNHIPTISLTLVTLISPCKSSYYSVITAVFETCVNAKPGKFHEATIEFDNLLDCCLIYIMLWYKLEIKRFFHFSCSFKQSCPHFKSGHWF